MCDCLNERLKNKLFGCSGSIELVCTFLFLSFPLADRFANGLTAM